MRNICYLVLFLLPVIFLGAYILNVFCDAQLVRRLQGQDENPFGDETSTPKRIFQLLNQVLL